MHYKHISSHRTHSENTYSKHLALYSLASAAILTRHTTAAVHVLTVHASVDSVVALAQRVVGGRVVNALTVIAAALASARVSH